MKKHGATNMRATVTGEKTLRKMTTWSSKEQVEANIDKIRAAAGTAVDMTTTGGMMGTVESSLINLLGAERSALEH